MWTATSKLFVLKQSLGHLVVNQRNLVPQAAKALPHLQLPGSHRGLGKGKGDAVLCPGEGDTVLRDSQCPAGQLAAGGRQQKSCQVPMAKAPHRPGLHPPCMCHSCPSPGNTEGWDGKKGLRQENSLVAALQPSAKTDVAAEASVPRQIRIKPNQNNANVQHGLVLKNVAYTY